MNIVRMKSVNVQIFTGIMVIAISIASVFIYYKNTYAEEKFECTPKRNDQQLTAPSVVKIGLYTKPEQGQKGWQPRGGVEIKTEECEVGITDEGGWVKIPVYSKQPFELITVQIMDRVYKVPTFGAKEGLKTGKGDGVYFSPDWILYTSTDACPDTYEYLKKTYGLKLEPSNKKVSGKFECSEE